MTSVRIPLRDTVVEIDGDGPPLVMVHGWPDTARLWDAQVAALKSRYRCARFTLPGFAAGPAGRAPRMYTLDEVVAVIDEVVAIAGHGDPVILVLHDWGCVFGGEWAYRHPSMVRAAVLVDVGDAGSRAHVASLPVKARLGIVAYQWWLAAAWKIGGAAGDAMTRKMAGWLRAPGPAASIGARMNYPYWLAWSGGLKAAARHAGAVPPCPVLFAYGRRKPFMFHSPEWARTLAARPGSEVVGFDTGHWVMTGASRSFDETLTRWLPR